MRRVILAVLLAALCARGAGATVGGPMLAEVLGWEAKTHRVYVAFVHRDEGGDPPSVCFFDLASAVPATVHFLEWGRRAEDSTVSRRIATLSRRLTVLRPESWDESLVDDGYRAPAPYDTVESDSFRRPRYVARVSKGFGWQYFRVLTLDPGLHAVRRLREYRIPGTTAWLMILSCVADPEEVGYEMQFPVLVGAGRGTPASAAGTGSTPLDSDLPPIDPRSFDVRR